MNFVLVCESNSTENQSPELIAKFEHVLFRLDEASGPEDINLPGFGLHPLKGDLAGYWAAKCPAIHLPFQRAKCLERELD